MEIMSIKGGSVGRLMENSILNFHFVFRITSLTFSALVLIFYIFSCSVSGLTRIAQYVHVPILVAIKATGTKCIGKQLKRHITRWRLSSGELGKGQELRLSLSSQLFDQNKCCVNRCHNICTTTEHWQQICCHPSRGLHSCNV